MISMLPLLYPQTQNTKHKMFGHKKRRHPPDAAPDQTDRCYLPSVLQDPWQPPQPPPALRLMLELMRNP